VLRLSDVLKPSKPAAREITGETEPERIARKLLALGPKLVAITMGSDGCLIASADHVEHVPAFRVDVKDTTGAGDAYMGGLSYALLQGWETQKTGRFANACAALCCTKVGARAMSRLPEVMALICSMQGASA
jgi:sugar/nucleoside kinase (ribokinase family)